MASTLPVRVSSPVMATRLRTGRGALSTHPAISLGHILGQVVTMGIWLFIDAFTGMKGNGLFLGLDV